MLCLQPMGSAAARGKLLDAHGYKPVLVSAADWAGLTDTKAKAKHLLAAAKKAVPAASSKVRWRVLPASAAVLKGTSVFHLPLLFHPCS